SRWTRVVPEHRPDRHATKGHHYDHCICQLLEIVFRIRADSPLQEQLMKIVCHREGLLSACQLASVAVASRDVKPVLKNLKAVVNYDRCTLMATDLELGIRLEVRGIKVEEPGEALLPTNRLIAILREATDEELTLEATPDACVIRGQFNEFEMPGEDPAAFPDLPAFAE